MPWKNVAYRGPDIMINLMRATNVPWQQRSIRNGRLISNAQYRERYRPSDLTWLMLFAPLEADTKFGHLGERELRNLHSQSSRRTSGAIETPYSKYVSMTSSSADTGWGEGFNPTIIFKFDIWRSDVWKGKHDLSRDPALVLWLVANIMTKPLQQRIAILSEQTPPDWDRGVEFEWLALGGTKIYNVQESTDGQTWTPSVASNPNADFWWETL
ncbi:hypothetical protein JCM16814_16410 [Desulfobaculum senezii]